MTIAKKKKKKKKKKKRNKKKKKKKKGELVSNIFLDRYIYMSLLVSC
jgi:cytoskeletal protein RodZ